MMANNHNHINGFAIFSNTLQLISLSSTRKIFGITFNSSWAKLHLIF